MGACKSHYQIPTAVVVKDDPLKTNQLSPDAIPDADPLSPYVLEVVKNDIEKCVHVNSSGKRIVCINFNKLRALLTIRDPSNYRVSMVNPTKLRSYLENAGWKVGYYNEYEMELFDPKTVV